MTTDSRAVVIAGLKQTGKGVLGGVLLILGKALSLTQAVLHLQALERHLTEREREMVHRVFGQSIALCRVRIVEGWAGLYSLSSRPLTLGNTIYLKKVSTQARPEIFIHECVHVWQYQNYGARYMGGALCAQWLTDDCYNWEKEISRGHSDWRHFNTEAQGRFLQDLWTNGSLVQGTTTTTGNGVFFDDDGEKKIGIFRFRDTDYTNEARQAVKEVQRAHSVESSTWCS